MSYVQGDKVQVWATVKDPATGLFKTSVPGLQLLVEQPDMPDGTGGTVADLSSGIVFDSVSHEFRATVDTGPAFGQWEYQFKDPGAQGAVQRSSFSVRRAIQTTGD